MPETKTVNTRVERSQRPPERDRTEEIRSEEVQEILGHTPRWIIRQGITLIFGLIVLLLVLAWLVEYPEIISGEMHLNTEVPTSKLSSNINGKLTQILVQDGEEVKPGQAIAFLENPMDISGVVYLEKYLIQVESMLAGRSVELPPVDTSLVFASVQAELTRLQENCLEYQHFYQDPYPDEEKRNIQNRIDHYRELLAINQEQVNLSQRDLENAKTNFEADEDLLKQGVIAPMTYLEEEARFNEKNQAVQGFLQMEVQNRITLANLEKRLLEVEHGYSEKMRNLTTEIQLSLGEIRNELSMWDQDYVIRSTYTGQLVWLDDYESDPFVGAGQALFAVVPPEGEIEGIIKLSTSGFGKVKIGQKVRLQMDNYPHQEYGILQGEVKTVASIPHKNQYRVTVALNQDLQTNYGYELQYLPEMAGRAEIVTENLTVLQRILYQLRKVMDRDKRKNASS
ncbi:HlyD family efflux transporter periplasmic adaptor subunit [bacterium SCSIO 12741]|nr:HlyD family efflux transporter periplasmic adaptor subunit [bacterium SCSIO 12741]